MLLQSIVFPGNDHWKKNRMQLFGDVQSSFRSTLHCNCSQWLEPLELFLCGSRHFTISSHQTRPKAIRFLVWLLCRPVQATASFDGKKNSACAGHLSNPWKKLNNKPSLWIKQQIANLNSLVILGLVCIPTKFKNSTFFRKRSMDSSDWAMRSPSFAACTTPENFSLEIS